MSIQEIENSVAQLGHKDFWSLMKWLDQLQEKRREEQIAHDVAAGCYDEFSEQSESDSAEGRGTPL